MTVLEKNIEAMLGELSARSQTETEFIQKLSDAINAVDDKLLRDVRRVSLQHEIRREAILTELQTLASQLCTLPVRQRPPVLPARDDPREQITFEDGEVARGADWRQAARNIQAELDATFEDLRH